MSYLKNKSDEKSKSVPKKFNNINKNFLDNNNAFNILTNTYRFFFPKSDKEKKMYNSVKILKQKLIIKSKMTNKSKIINKSNIFTNNISINSIKPLKKNFYYITNRNDKKLNYEKINYLLSGIDKSKKKFFNYNSRDKNLNDNENVIKKNEPDKKISKIKSNNRCKNNFNIGFNFSKKIICIKKFKNKNIKNISKTNISKTSSIKNKEIQYTKESIINDNPYKKNYCKKKSIIGFNYRKKPNINKTKNNPEKNKVKINQIMNNIKNQIKFNQISNEHIVKSEKISPLKIKNISKNIKNNYISKDKDKKSEKDDVNEKENMIKKIPSIISKKSKKESDKNDKEDKEKSKTEVIKNYFDSNNSNSYNNSVNYSDNISLTNSSNKHQISQIEVKPQNSKICLMDSMKSIKSKQEKNEEEGSSSKKRENSKTEIINIDIPISIKKKDPQYVNEYIGEILESLLVEENKHLDNKYINPYYLENPDCEITPEMRTVAVDWLVLVHHKIFKFKENTFFLAIQLFDRYLSKIILSIEKTELLLLTSFSLASKHEEVEYVNMKETLQLSQNKFSKEDVVKMEYNILKQINFEILAPTMCDYFQIFSFMSNFDNNNFFQGLYILNIVLVDFHMLKYPNCILALAVIKLINKTIDKELIDIINKIIKNKNLSQIGKFMKFKRINSICNKIKILYETFLDTKYKNIQEKFAQGKYNYASTNTSI